MKILAKFGIDISRGALLGIKANKSSWIAAGLMVLVSGCAAEYIRSHSSVSPDGKYVVDATTEYQAANDPDVFWQHISIRPASMPEPVMPGNVAVYSCRTTPSITWKSNSEVELVIVAADVGGSFKEMPRRESRDGVTVRFKLSK